MKKIIWVFFLILVFTSIYVSAKATDLTIGGDNSNTTTTMSDCPASGDGGATGLVPCGVTCSCTIANFFAMLARIYNFIVLQIATPLAVIAITIGGIFMMASAGNPSLFGKGKQILIVAIIGLVLVFCSYLIVNSILGWIGFKGNWASPF
jgi:hypothetical protein